MYSMKAHSQDEEETCRNKEAPVLREEVSVPKLVLKKLLMDVEQVPRMTCNIEAGC